MPLVRWQGLWAKAIAETGGDQAAANAHYLKLRVEIMKAEAEVTDYVRKQAAKEIDKESASDTYSAEVEMARRFLYGEGYEVKIFAGKFRVQDPAGGCLDRGSRHHQQYGGCGDDGISVRCGHVVLLHCIDGSGTRISPCLTSQRF